MNEHFTVTIVCTVCRCAGAILRLKELKMEHMPSKETFAFDEQLVKGGSNTGFLSYSLSVY